jgi:hypothetical protein
LYIYFKKNVASSALSKSFGEVLGKVLFYQNETMLSPFKKTCQDEFQRDVYG